MCKQSDFADNTGLVQIKDMLNKAMSFAEQANALDKQNNTQALVELTRQAAGIFLQVTQLLYTDSSINIKGWQRDMIIGELTDFNPCAAADIVTDLLYGE